MDWLTSPLSLIGILGAAAMLQKSGVDIVGTIKWLFDQHKGHTPVEETALLRNDFQKLLTSQEQLVQYTNHDTTDKLNSIEDGLKALALVIGEHVRQHDKTNFILEDIRTNGIRCRNN